jgi:hypothetical protein
MSLEVLHGDRRADRRYESELPIRFEYMDGRNGLCTGSGVTIELSRGGIRFQSPDPPPLRTNLQAWIAWPFLLQGVCRLELLVRGQVISSTGRGIVLRMRSHEFRTCGERSFSEEPEQPRPWRVA